MTREMWRPIDKDLQNELNKQLFVQLEIPGEFSGVRMTAPRRRSNSRIEPLLDAAARRFARQGYRETTVREIAADAGMLPSSQKFPWNFFLTKQLFV